jgi:hypothetical protein
LSSPLHICPLGASSLARSRTGEEDAISSAAEDHKDYPLEEAYEIKLIENSVKKWNLAGARWQADG